MRSEELLLSETQLPGSSKNPMRPKFQIEVQSVFQQLLTALVLALVKD